MQYYAAPSDSEIEMKPTPRQLAWYYPPYKPSPEQARKDVDNYLRWRGIVSEDMADLMRGEEGRGLDN